MSAANSVRRPDAKTFGEINAFLRAWFAEHRRDMPWRESYHPYSVWISEIMLQQTQVKTVEPYFRRWMEKYPDVSALAEEPLERLYKSWQGLGYYRRCRSIKETAEILVSEHGGEFPCRRDALLKLPGIGPYTAGAIMNIAFEKPAPMVDGNAARVLSRIFDWDQPVETASTRKRFEEWSKGVFSAGNPRFAGQAMMELGALVCKPRNPACGSCPLHSLCGAKREGTVEQRPVAGKKPAPVPLDLLHYVIRKDGMSLMVRMKPRTWWAGLWGFPWCEKGKALEFEAEAGIVRGDGLKAFRHGVTKYKVNSEAVSAFLGKKGGFEGELFDEYRWIEDKALQSLSLSLPAFRIAKHLPRWLDA